MAESKNDIVRCGLIQCSNPINDESVPVADIQKAMWEKHIPFFPASSMKGMCFSHIAF